MHTDVSFKISVAICENQLLTVDLLVRTHIHSVAVVRAVLEMNKCSGAMTNE